MLFIFFFLLSIYCLFSCYFGCKDTELFQYSKIIYRLLKLLFPPFTSNILIEFALKL